MITEGNQNSLQHPGHILRGKLTPDQKIHHLRKRNTTNKLLLRITLGNNTIRLNTSNRSPPLWGTHPEYVFQ
ncbi:hypothetical protein HNR54_000741 [Methanothermobacter sp. DSM 3267]